MGVTLQVQPGLLDLVGWKNLGEPVRIFSILTDEGVKEATDQLTIDTLRRATAPRPPQPTKANSFFDLPCAELADRVADAALTTGSYPVRADDGLLLCDTTWLAEGRANTGWMGQSVMTPANSSACCLKISYANSEAVSDNAKHFLRRVHPNHAPQLSVDGATCLWKISVRLQSWMI
jgi:hypothetical protein